MNYRDATDQEVFDDIKAEAIKIWESFEESKYRDKTINIISGTENGRDRAGYIVGMFDPHSRAMLLKAVKPESKPYLIGLMREIAGQGEKAND